MNAGAHRCAPAFLFGGTPLPKRGAKANRRNPGRDTQDQWAAVVEKATPRIVESLIEAAQKLGARAPVVSPQLAAGDAQEVEDESLAALLLRFLHSSETNGTSSSQAPGSTAVTFESENPMLG